MILHIFYNIIWQDFDEAFDGIDKDGDEKITEAEWVAFYVARYKQLHPGRGCCGGAAAVQAGTCCIS